MENIYRGIEEHMATIYFWSKVLNLNKSKRKAKVLLELSDEMTQKKTQENLTWFTIMEGLKM